MTVPIALVGTLAVMKWEHFTLDIMSLMALTISVGFVVDDASWCWKTSPATWKQAWTA